MSVNFDMIDLKDVIVVPVNSSASGTVMKVKSEFHLMPITSQSISLNLMEIHK